MSRLHSQEDEEINTYYGDQKSYVNHLNQLDESQLEQQDLLDSSLYVKPDLVNKSISEFTDAIDRLNNFNFDSSSEEDDEDANVKKDTLEDGTVIYAIVQEGTFESDKIEIPGFTTDSTEIEPINATLTRNAPSNIRRRKGAIEKDGTSFVSWPINTTMTDFKAEGDVDTAIKDLKKIGVDTNFGTKIDVSNNPDLLDKIQTVNFEELKVDMPKGLEGDFILAIGNEKVDVTKCYNDELGVLDLAQYAEKYGEPLDIKVEDGKLDFNVHVTAIDVDKAGNDIVFDEGHFELASEVNVKGDVVVYGDDLKDDEFTLEDLPKDIKYECAPTISKIKVSEFSGKIQYDIEDLNIDPISLNDIPDMLSQDSTNIKLANPQIYLRLNNPLSENHLYAEAGLAMTAKRKDGSNKKIALGDNKLKMDNAYNVFCLTTDGNMPQNEMHKDYKDAVNKKFDGFSDILSGNGGNGLPDNIEIDVIEPQIPEQDISEFKLDNEIDKVEGTYLFYAPLALKDETSFIIYQDTLDGWYDETLEKLTISALMVKADVNSEIPLKVEISFNPIDVNGKIIRNVKSNVVKLNATKDMQPIEINLEGEIKNLDGIIIRAKLIGAQGESIAPSQTINFKNLKIAVTGEYVDEF